MLLSTPQCSHHQRGLRVEKSATQQRLALPSTLPVEANGLASSAAEADWLQLQGCLLMAGALARLDRQFRRALAGPLIQLLGGRRHLSW